jgi:hypothetical protein
MNYTKEQKQEKDRKISLAIASIRKSGKPTTVKLIAEITGYQVYDLYNQPAIRELMTAPNPSYRYIIGMSYTVKVKLGRKNTATLEIYEPNSLRTPCHTVSFAPNGKLSKELTAYMPTARPGTAMDIALKEAADWVKQEFFANV